MASTDVEDIYELSPLQGGLLYHCLHAPQTEAYTVQVTYALDGALDADRLRDAWEQAMERHRVFRTSFHWDLEKPVQIVRSDVSLPWTVHDWSDASASEQRSRLDQLMDEDRRKGYDLDSAPLIRLYLIRRGPASHWLLWSRHHLLLDGWSVANVVDDVLRLYHLSRQGRETRLPGVRPYRDYIGWVQQQDREDARRFWQGLLDGFADPTPLPYQHASGASASRAGREGVQAESFQEHDVSLSRETSDRLREQAKQHGLTLNTLVQSAWAVLLGRLTNEADVTFGTTVSGRPSDLEGVEDMVGLFVNTLPVRASIRQDEPMTDVLERLQKRLTQVRQFAHVPLAEIREWADIPGGMPLFETLLVFQNYSSGRTATSPDPEAGGNGKAALSVGTESASERAHYPLTIIVSPSERIRFTLHSQKERLPGRVVEELLKRWVQLLEAMTDGLSRPVEAFRLLSPSERAQMLRQWSGSEHLISPETWETLPESLADAFETQAARHPNETAIRGANGRTLTYAELDRHSGRIARQLVSLGVGIEDPVGIAMERSLEAVVATVAVMRAGGTYVPMAPEYPASRLNYLLVDSGVSCLITNASTLEKTSALRDVIDKQEVEACRLETDTLRLRDVPEETDVPDVVEETSRDTWRGRVRTPDQRAFLIYTSGSTGRPKGVAGTHRNAIDLVCESRFADLSENSVIAYDANPSFDLSVLQIWSCLARGGRVEVISPDQMRASPADQIQNLRERGCTDKITTTALFHRIAESGASVDFLQTLSFGGESAAPRWVMKAVNEGGAGRVLNMYGPTEATTLSTMHEATPNDAGKEAIPIGRPSVGTVVYVLDEAMRPVPVGVPGELYIGGSGLARGYHANPRKTAGAFVPNPFADATSERTGTEPGSRLYRTGDYVRWNANGDLVFVGRIDRQVKLRGFRVELGAIEAHLLDAPGVEQAAVKVFGRGAAQRLVGYVQPGVDGVRATLAETVPSHMVPDQVIGLDTLPLTPNGKIDRDALPQPSASRTKRDETYAPPRDAVEHQLVELWERVLQVEPVGIHHDFVDLGGNSLLALKLQTHVQQTFDQTFPISLLVEQTTVAEVADVIRGAVDVDEDDPVVPLQTEGESDPLFFVHPGSGQVYGVFALAKALRKQRPVYGLRDPWVANGALPPSDLETVAARYAEAIRAAHPEGPYHIAGWSYGGQVAFEIAHQLAREGCEVGSVVVVDTAAPHVLQETFASSSDAYLLGIIAEELGLADEYGEGVQAEDLQSLSRDEQVRRVADLVDEATLFGESAESFVSTSLDVFRRRVEGIEQYTPSGTYEGTLTLVRAGDRTRPEDTESEMLADARRTRQQRSRAQGWDDLVSGPVRVDEVPGDHSSIMQAPNVDAMADAIEDAIRTRTERLEAAPSAG